MHPNGLPPNKRVAESENTSQFPKGDDKILATTLKGTWSEKTKNYGPKDMGRSSALLLMVMTVTQTSKRYYRRWTFTPNCPQEGRIRHRAKEGLKLIIRSWEIESDNKIKSNLFFLCA